jgi:hypothetical protein
MKDAEDEAFDDLAKRQGDWGGGFKAKQAMAADKYSDIVSDGGLDPRNQFDAQPAQEPVACVMGTYGGMFVVAPLNSAVVLPTGMALYATPQHTATWVGLTDGEMKAVCAQTWSYDPYLIAAAIEAKLKERNS